MGIKAVGDHIANLTMAGKIRDEINGLEEDVEKAQDGVRLIQTAEDALREIDSILSKMRNLAVQATNDKNTDQDREKIQEEIGKLAKEVTEISTGTEFKGQKLLGGEFKDQLYIGANQDQNISLKIGDMSAKGLNLVDSEERR